MHRTATILLIALLSGCSPFVPVIKVADVPKETLQKAYQIQIFEVGNSTSHPQVSDYLGNITAYSCKNMLTDPPASKGDALIQLRLKALELGADAVLDITFDTRGTDTWGTNCWESVQVSGVAVKFKQPNP